MLPESARIIEGAPWENSGLTEVAMDNQDTEIVVAIRIDIWALSWFDKEIYSKQSKYSV
jgi:hypothetical protein